MAPNATGTGVRERHADQGTRSLVVENLSKSFGGEHALKAVDFDVRPGKNGPHQVDPGQGVPRSAG